MGPATTLLTVALGAIHAWLAARALLGMSRVQRLKPTRLGGGPRVSVIVPARNERGRVGKCVKSLLSQDYGNLEVIVVDDSSTDGTPEEALEEAFAGFGLDDPEAPGSPGGEAAIREGSE